MSKSARDLLLRGVAAAKEGAAEEARFYLDRVLMIDASDEQRMTAWLWLSEISENPDKKRSYLEAILSIYPAHPVARRKLAVLDGRLKPEDIIDASRLSPAEHRAVQPVQARRFVCPQCGGRMVFRPDGETLTCDYCTQRQPSPQALQKDKTVEEEDFVVALATARGHTQPVATRSITCQGCGTSFILGARMLSSSCPYCASAYVVDDAAQRPARQWLEAGGLDTHLLHGPPTGVYFPVWTFDIGGDIVWRGSEREADAWAEQSGSTKVNEDDLPVPARRNLPAPLAKTVGDFSLRQVVTYDPAYLADWPAETYSISVSDASLVARRQVLEKARQRVARGGLGSARELKLSSTGLIFESYKLVLVPLWILTYHDGPAGKDKQYTVVVNGQTGQVRGDKPARGLRRAWAWLMGDES
jgi:predicted RNA-binding Zn-ribbon protein involved in translation (DUF1610 family)